MKRIFTNSKLPSVKVKEPIYYRYIFWHYRETNITHNCETNLPLSFFYDVNNNIIAASTVLDGVNYLCFKFIVENQEPTIKLCGLEHLPYSVEKFTLSKTFVDKLKKQEIVGLILFPLLKLNNDSNYVIPLIVDGTLYRYYSCQSSTWLVLDKNSQLVYNYPEL